MISFNNRRIQYCDELNGKDTTVMCATFLFWLFQVVAQKNGSNVMKWSVGIELFWILPEKIKIREKSTTCKTLNTLISNKNNIRTITDKLKKIVQ